MADVAEIKCPHCKKTLRIPTAWADQAMRCRFCHQVFEARQRAGASALKVSVTKPALTPAVEPKAAPKAKAERFAAERPGAAAVARRVAPPRNGLAFKGLLVGAGVVLGAGVATIVIAVILGAAILKMVNPEGGPQQQQIQATDKKDTSPTATIKDTVRETSKGGDPKKDLDTAKIKPDPKDDEKDKDPPPVRTDDIYPRRALLISVNDYLLTNPLAHGRPAQADFKGSSATALAEQLHKNLDFPKNQMAELSTKATAPALPQKSTIENTIVEFLNTARRQDHILLLFAGHAVQIDKEAYLVPIEGKINDAKTLISLGWLYQELARCRARQKVLVLDVCRFDPAGGAERSGAAPMGDILAGKLKAPPAGVQVWVSCAAKEQSWESGNGSLFLEVLCKTCHDLPTGPAFAIPVKRWQTRVQREIEERTKSLSHKQTPVLAGNEPVGAGPFNPEEQPPPDVAIKPPTIPGGKADTTLVQGILDEVALLPPTTAGKASLLTPAMLPDFSAQVLGAYQTDYRSILDYKDKEAEFPLRYQIARSILALKDQVVNFRQTLPGKAPDLALKKDVKAEQLRIGKPIFVLKDALKELMATGENHRNAESKRLQTLYDYVVLRLKARIVHVVEYNYTLAEIAKDNVPALEPGDKLYRLTAQEKVNVNESYIKDYVKDLKKGWPEFAKTHAKTPWEFVAFRDNAVILGLAWKAAKK
jgi:hypothetical protein